MTQTYIRGELLALAHQYEHEAEVCRQGAAYLAQHPDANALYPYLPQTPEQELAQAGDWKQRAASCRRQAAEAPVGPFDGQWQPKA